MTPTQSFFAHWYFHIPNLVLAALMYSIAGRYILELLFARQPDAVILRAFRGVTDPPIRIVRVVTPAIVPNGLVIVFTIAWLMAARIFWFLTCVAAGMRPNIGA